jgi:hypothetical protein
METVKPEPPVQPCFGHMTSNDAERIAAAYTKAYEEYLVAYTLYLHKTKEINV